MNVSIVSVIESPAAPPVPLVLEVLLAEPPAPPAPLLYALVVPAPELVLPDGVSTAPPQAVRATRASVERGSQVRPFIVRLLLGGPPVADLVTGPDHTDSMFFMVPSPFEPFPTIETARLVLRAPTLDDVEGMFHVASDPRVVKYLGRAPATRETTRAKLVKVTEALVSGASILWILIDRETGAHVGSACLWNWNEGDRRAEVGYDLAPSRWGQGLVTEAMTPILLVGWERMKLHSLEGQVHPENVGSIRVLEKLGFVREAYFRENHFNGESFEDTVVYSKLSPR